MLRIQKKMELMKYGMIVFIAIKIALHAKVAKYFAYVAKIKRECCKGLKSTPLK